MKYLLLVVALITMVSTAMAYELIVAPDGDDTNPGSSQKPFATLHRAQQAVREHLKQNPHDSVKVLLREGRHYLTQPLELTAADSGTAYSPMSYEAFPGERPVCVGGKRLQLNWKPYNQSIQVASVTEETVIDQLIINGKRKVLARFPNYNPAQRYYNGISAMWDRAKNWKNPETAYIHALHQAKWGSGHAVIVRNEKGELKERMVSIDTTTQGNGAYLNSKMRFVENVFEELDASGEWFYDQGEHLLYYFPEEKEDLTDAIVEAVCTPHLIRLEGDAVNPVRSIQIKGISFQGASPTWKQTIDHLPNGGDFVVHRGGAITLRGTENCIIRECDFFELDGNAVFLDGYNRHDTVSGCLFRNLGANAVALCGAAETMRGDQFFTVLEETFEAHGQIRNKWNTPDGWRRIPDDRTPGPKSANYPSDCLITDNLITEIGELEKQTAGVLMSLTMNNTVSYNTIYKLPRAGICLNDGSWGGHVIEFNDVFDTVRETADHGPFNSWGKDRYWIWEDHNGNHQKNPDAKKYCLIDAVKTTLIRNNRFSHPLQTTHSWGIDLDDGSTNYHIYNNLTIGCAVKLREGFHRTVENNIFIASGRNNPGKHVCFEDNEDVYRKNITVNIHSDVVWYGIHHYPVQMKEIDYNCYFTPGTTPQWITNGRGKKRGTTLQDWNKEGMEVHSIIADPLFVDPARGDYRVKPDSPALKLGFKNFRMDQFGVVTTRLKHLVPERSFPACATALEQQVNGASTSRGDDTIVDFLGGKIKDMTSEAEKSAVGIGEITGVLVMEAPDNSPLYKAGLRIGQLIIKLDNEKVDNLQKFMALCKTKKNKIIQVEVHDDLQKRVYELKL
ncbi:MAG: hypothetical protein ABFR90_01195 [Planctomycetota bacterium]